MKDRKSSIFRQRFIQMCNPVGIVYFLYIQMRKYSALIRKHNLSFQV